MPDEGLGGKAGAVWRVDASPMRAPGDIKATIEVQLARRRSILLAYRDECARIADHHGVQDASSDLRELDAAEAALRWVLGERETLGY